jgi:hypothetical protein
MKGENRMNVMPIHPQIDVLFEENNPSNMSLLVYVQSKGEGLGELRLEIGLQVDEGPFKHALRDLIETTQLRERCFPLPLH